MATSGTFIFSVDLVTCVEEAFELCGLEANNGYDFQTARRSLNLLFLEWQNKGLNLWTIKQDDIPCEAGISAYDLSAERVDVIEASIRTNSGETSQFDQTMKQQSISNFAQQSNKLTPGKPVQFWIEKKVNNITLNVWPVPNSSAYSIHYFYMERIEDTGVSGDYDLSVPARFIPAMVTGLACKIALKKAPDKLPTLELLYDRAWNDAADADRNKASFFVKPARAV